MATRSLRCGILRIGVTSVCNATYAIWIQRTTISGEALPFSLRKHIELAESVGGASEEYEAVAWRGTLLGIVAGVIALVIIALMVFKPALWG